MQLPGPEHYFLARLVASPTLAALLTVSLSLKRPEVVLPVGVGAHLQAAFLCLPLRSPPKKKKGAFA